MKKMDLQLFAGLLSKDTTLSYKVGGAPTFTEVVGLQSTPELGSDPDQVETTTLADSKKTYIKGLQDTDTLQFGILYDATVYDELNTVAETGGQVNWQVKFPDGSTFDFTGEAAVKMGGAEVNGALTFTLSVVVSAGPDFVPVA
ncbi:phage tail protein [Enterococcus sp. BWB1-3]|uniref:phage tail tube protein n=1 Tax=Enterococcus sp. BWB1-3 TaxID=2787713 RepID=UPI001920F9C9|nr:phage tail tube protein [Enterococcus sp. BWB1-3]MBL1228132.1 phage tail protein [Enterococcus sp. BWB1-3]